MDELKKLNDAEFSEYVEKEIHTAVDALSVLVVIRECQNRPDIDKNLSFALLETFFLISMRDIRREYLALYMKFEPELDYAAVSFNGCLWNSMPRIEIDTNQLADTLNLLENKE